MKEKRKVILCSPEAGYNLKAEKVGRNQLCPCGSGKKAKKQEAAKYAKEKAMCLAFAKGGNKIVHLGEVARMSSADVTCNGMKADLKRTGSENNMIDYAKHARKSQGAKLVLFQFDKWNAKMASALKEITKLKIHGKYFITGRDNEIIDF